ncbi:hypothetical protein, partial [Akkermansia sp.]|uniref:hypothetical protein n=1 Tax=Akkermansia sp. TaxID=1872421 RepID=UPI003AF8A0FD
CYSRQGAGATSFCFILQDQAIMQEDRATCFFLCLLILAGSGGNAGTIKQEGTTNEYEIYHHP